MAPEESSRPDSANARDEELTAIVAAQTAPLVERIYRLEQTVAALTRQSIPGDAAATEEVPPAATAATPPPPPPPAFEAVAETPAATPAPQASFEDRLGSQIFNRIAIVAILVGATLFLKLAVDKHWIGPVGRVLTGLVSGAALIVWSERFRRREFVAFSYSLKAIGSGVLYLTLWASLHLFQLVPSAVAFGLMLLVTLWNAWMAWSQDAELLGAYALAGAFATPALLSTGGNHQVFLFSYLFSVDLATLALVRLHNVRLKPDGLAVGSTQGWERLLLGALPVTSLYFIAWYSQFYSRDQLVSSSIFIGLFLLAFMTAPFAVPGGDGQLRVPARVLSDALLPLGNAVFGALAFYSVLQDSGLHAWLPWGALVLAALYLAVMRVPQSVLARNVHLSLAIVFLTIAIPLKATGRWITIGWLVEGVVLLWISARLESPRESLTESEIETETASSHTLLRRLAVVALILGFFGAAALPYRLDRNVQTAIFNQRFATALAGIAALGVCALTSCRAAQVANACRFGVFPAWPQLAAACTVALNLLALQAGICEIGTFWNSGYAYATTPESALPTALSVSGFLMLYGAALLAAGFWRRNAFLRWQGLILLVIAIAKTFLYDVRSLSEGYRVASFLGLGMLLLLVSFAYVRRTSRSSGS